jgi:cell division protein FtsW
VKELKLKIDGDKSLWVISIALAITSLLAVFSASSHLAAQGSGSMAKIMVKHLGFLVTGFVVMYIAHRQPYRRYGPLSLILLPLVVFLLVLTLLQGQTINDANASRWLRVGGFTFQTSALASLVLLIYIARYLTQNIGKHRLRHSLVFLIIPILGVCGLVLPANLSTAAIIFTLSMMLMFIGQYPIKYLLGILLSGLLLLAMFILLVKAFPGISNRVDTWESRIESFINGTSEDGYQVEKARMAIANGGVLGRGAGKSVHKNFLPQSNSDFIYAVILEEYGLVGGLVVLVLYVMLFVRILRIATKAPTFFGSLLTVAGGSGIMLQAFVNMGVAVNIFPVTGQTLPLISAGGSSIWMSFMALGIILSVSRSFEEEEIAQSVEGELAEYIDASNQSIADG